jgi:hypothetical protein
MRKEENPLSFLLALNDQMAQREAEEVREVDFGKQLQK